MLWGALLGGTYYAIRRDRAGALWLAALVLSHWVLDYVSHRPDMPLWPGGPKVGLGLWYSLPATLVVEFALLAIGAWLYASVTRPRDRIGTYGWWALIATLAAIYAASVAGPPPPSVQVLAMSGLLGWLFVVWAYWIDRHRARGRLARRPPATRGRAPPIARARGRAGDRSAGGRRASAAKSRCRCGARPRSRCAARRSSCARGGRARRGAAPAPRCARRRRRGRPPSCRARRGSRRPGARAGPARRTRIPACRRSAGCRRRACESRCAKRTSPLRAAVPPIRASRSARGSARARRAPEERDRELRNARRLGAIDAVAIDEPLDRHRARVLVERASQEIVEHARAATRRRPHRCVRRPSSATAAVMIARPPASTGARSPFSALSFSREMCPAASMRRRSRASPVGVMPPAENAFCSRMSASAIAVPDDAYASRQWLAPEAARDRLDLDARHRFRGVHRRGRDLAVGEVTLRHPDAADRQRLEPLGLQAAADDELGRTAADVDDESRLQRARQLVRDAEEGEPRLLVPADDVDRESDRALGAPQELAGVRGHAKRVGRNHAHRRGMQAGEPFAEACEAGERVSASRRA